MNYNRILIAALTGLTPLFYAVSGQSATTGTVTINGMVPAVCAVVVAPEAGALNIADISIGDSNRLVATVTETCNDPDGYTMTVVGTNSTNHTGLFKDTVSNDTHPFTITYNNVAVASGGVVTDANAPGIGLARPVKITYSTDATLTPSAAFTYQEVLTFTIAAK